MLEIVVEEDLLRNAAARGAELLAGLEQLAQRHPIVTNARGKGLMCAVDLPDGKTRDAVIDACFADGMIVLRSGARSVRFRPTLTLDAAIVADGLARLERALVGMRRHVSLSTP